MDIKRMRKAELIELNEQLNESRIHCDAVIEALRAELAAAKAELEQAYAVIGALKLGIAMPGTEPAQATAERVVRNNKLVHEFDPSIEGSYLSAMRRARELGGVVRRAQQ